MKKILILTLSFLFAALPLWSVNFAFAVSDYANAVVNFSQGNLAGGGPIVDPARTDPSKALGVEDLLFVSLGFGGTLDLAFPNYMSGNLTITTVERTGGVYPEEKAEVFVSKDATNWTSIGTVNNSGGTVEDLQHFFTLPANGCIKYVRLVDTTDPALYANMLDADAFDVDAVRADYDTTCTPEEGTTPCCEKGDDIVMNDNSAFVANDVTAVAKTGDNYAGGSYAGDGGNGGSITATGGEVEESGTGAGGTGGNAGLGGTVLTGDATATVSVINLVNSSRTEIDRCACSSSTACNSGDVVVINESRAMVLNGTRAIADTGDNAAKGSYAGDGGSGGDITATGEGSEVEESGTGAGANGGTSVDGGLVQTGNSYSDSSLINVINRMVTRIWR